jgi:hypothetical protein
VHQVAVEELLPALQQWLPMCSSTTKGAKKQLWMEVEVRHPAGDTAARAWLGRRAGAWVVVGLQVTRQKKYPPTMARVFPAQPASPLKEALQEEPQPLEVLLAAVGRAPGEDMWDHIKLGE